MTQLLVIREHILKFYQSNARYLKPLFRFLVSLLTFATINESIGYNPVFRPWYVAGILAVICTILPLQVLLLFAALFMIFHVYYVSFILTMVLTCIFAILYFIYIRFMPEHGYVILAFPILSTLHIPYVLPILLGLIGAPIGIVPIICGVVMSYTINTITNVIGTSTADSILLYNQVIQQIIGNRDMYLTIGVFIIVFFAVYVIRKCSVDYAFDLAIGVGGILNILLFLAVNYFTENNGSVLNVLAYSLLSVVIVWIIQFFRLTLSYSGVEQLQFEDDEYYYYVKAVPKVSIATPERNVKRFNAHLYSDVHGRRTEAHKENPSDNTETVRPVEHEQDSIMEKHDFEFKVSVEDQDFEDLEDTRK